MNNGIPASDLVDNFSVERKLKLLVPFELIKMFPSLSKRLRYRREATFKEHILQLEDIIGLLIKKHIKFSQNTYKIQEEQINSQKE